MEHPQQNNSPMSETLPLQTKQIDDDYSDETAGACGCGIFQGLCFSFNRDNNNGTYGYRQQQQHEESREESWVITKVKKLKEMSELVAGPKWKNFIRRCSGVYNKKRRTHQYQYDPQSYALNFDEGIDREGEDGVFNDFSSRFVVPLSSFNRVELGT